MRVRKRVRRKEVQPESAQFRSIFTVEAVVVWLPHDPGMTSVDFQCFVSSGDDNSF
jgi:hypothetical protein